MPDPKSKLYTALSGKYDLGTQEEFNSKMGNPESRKKLYTAVSEEFDLGSYEEFESKVSTQKKKVAPTSTLPNQKLVSNGEKATSSGGVKRDEKFPKSNLHLLPTTREKQLKDELSGVKVTSENMDEVNAKTDELQNIIKSKSPNAVAIKKQQELNNDPNFLGHYEDFKSKTSTVTDDDLNKANQEFETAKSGTGFWQKTKEFGTNALNVVANKMNQLGFIDEVGDLKVAKPLDEKLKQADEAFLQLKKDAKRNKEVIPTFTKEQRLEKAKELFLKEKTDSYIASRQKDYLQEQDDADGGILQSKFADFKKGELASLDENEKTLLNQQSIQEVTHKRLGNELIELQKKSKENGHTPELEQEYQQKLAQYKQVEADGLETINKYVSNRKNIGNAADNLDVFKRNYSLWGNITGNVESAGESLVSGGFGALDYGMELKKQATGTQSPTAVLLQSTFKNASKDVQALSEKTASEIEKPISINNINSFSDFGDWLMNDVTAKQVPIFAMMATGVGGVAGIGATSLGTKYEDMQGEVQRGEKKYSTTEMLLHPVGYGLAETASAAVDLMVLKNAGRVVASATAPERRMIAQGMWSKAKNYLGASIEGGVAETLDETGTQGVENLIDGKPFTEGMADAGAAGGAMGFLIPFIAANYKQTIKPFTTDTKIQEGSAQVLQLQSQLDNPNLDNETKTIIKENLDKTKSNVEVLIKKAIGNVQSLSNAQFKEIISLEKTQANIKNKVEKIQFDDNLDDNLKKQILGNLNSEFEANNQRRLDLLERGANVQLEKLDDKEVIRLKDKASRELMKEQNPDGTKSISLNDDDISKRAIEINKKEIESKKEKNAETESTVTKTESQAEVQKPADAEQEKIVESNNSQINESTEISLSKAIDEKIPATSQIKPTENETAQKNTSEIDGSVRPGINSVEQNGITEQQDIANENLPKSVDVGPSEIETKVAEKAKIQPKNFKDLYDVNRKVFGQNKVKSLASAVVMDKMIGTMAKRSNTTKDEIYKTLEFKKSSEEDVKSLSEKGKVLYQIVGKNAKLSEGVKSNLTVAREMEKSGKDVKQIRVATGWEKGADGKWGYEIDDSKTSLTQDTDNLERGPLSELLSHKELFELYPDFKNIEIVPNYNMESIAVAITSKNRILVNPYETKGNQDLLTTILHEVQHFIQKKEGFSKGGSEESIRQILEDKISNKTTLKRITDKLFNRNKNTSINSSKQSNPQEILNQADYKLYESLVGEVQARNVETRQSMSSEERKNTLLSDTEDVSRESQIILFQDSKGAVQLAEDGKAVIHALTSPDVSTPLHELAHVYERYLTDSEKKHILESSGNNEWNTETSEFFARGFEKYLSLGITPDPTFQKIFDKFKEWLTDIYNGIKDSEIDIKLNPGMEKIYTQMLGVEVNQKSDTFKASENGKPYTATFEDGILEFKDDNGNKPSTPTRKKLQDQWADNFDFTKGKTAIEQDKINDFSTWDEDIAEHSENPIEVAETLINAMVMDATEGLDTKSKHIAETIGGKAVERSSFANRAGKKGMKDIPGALALQYFSKKGKGSGLDIIAQSAEIAMYGDWDSQNPKITEDEVFDFINENPSGINAFLNSAKKEKINILKTAFTHLTGLPANDKYLNTAIEQGAEKDFRFNNDEILYQYSEEDLISLSNEYNQFIEEENGTAEKTNQTDGNRTPIFDKQNQKTSEKQSEIRKTRRSEATGSERQTGKSGETETFLDKVLNQDEISGFLNFLDDLKLDDNDLKTTLPFLPQTWNAFIEAVKISVQAGNTMANAIKEAVKILQNKGFSKKEIKNIQDYFGEKIEVKYNILSDKFKELETALKTTKKQPKQIAETLDIYVEKGVISARQASILTKKALKTNFNNPLSVEKYLDYAHKVMRNADYKNMLVQANKSKRTINRALKSKSLVKSVITIDTVKLFLKINPSNVSDVNEYNSIATSITNNLKGVKIDGKGNVSNEAFEISNNSILKYTEEENKIQEAKAKESLITNYQSFIDSGVIDPDKMSLQEIQTIVDSVEEGDESVDGLIDNSSDEKLKNQEEVLRKITDSQIAGLPEFLTEQRIVLGDGTIESVLSDNEKSIIEKIRTIDSSQLGLKDLVKLNMVLNNITQNNDFSGSGDMEIISDYQKSKAELSKIIDKSGIVLSKITDTFFNSLRSVNQIPEFITKSTKVAAEIQRLTGISDVFNGHARAKIEQNRTIKAYQELISRSGKDINNPENRYRRGIYSRIIQHLGGTDIDMQNEFNRVKSWIKQTGERLSSLDPEEFKREVKEGVLVNKIYDELLDGSNSIEEVKSKLEKTAPKNIKLVDFWINKHDSKAEQFFENAEIYNNKILEKLVNYTPTSVKGLEGKSFVETKKERDIFEQNFFSKKVDDKIAGSKNSRSKSNKLTSGTVLDLDFDNVQSKKYYEAVYDIETNKAIAKVRRTFSDPEMAKLLGGKTNLSMIENSLRKSVLAQKGKLPIPEAFERQLAKTLSVFQAKGARIALGSVTQLPKQYISVAVNTLINLGTESPLYFKALSIGNNLELFSHANIGLRGETKAGYNKEVDLNEIDKIDFNNNLSKGLSKTQELGAKISEAIMKPLEMSDVAVARSSWLSFYMKDLKRQGINIDNIDWKTEHIKPNSEAISYAEQEVSRNQNPNDASSMASAFKGTGAIQILKNLFLPFSTFSLNQRVRMTNDVQKIIYGGEKAEAFKSLAATLAEQAVFNSLKIYAIGALATGGANAFLASFGYDDDDNKIVDGKKKSKFMANTFSDFFFSGLGTLPQEGLQHISNQITNVAIGKKYFYQYDPTKYGQPEFIKYMGIYGTPLATTYNLYDMSQYVDGETEKITKGGRESIHETKMVKMTEKEKSLSRTIFAIDMMNFVGFSDAFINQMNNKAKIKFKSQMEEDYGGKFVMELYTKKKKQYKQKDENDIKNKKRP